ncbi:MAG: hypothetical protein HWE27_15870 [Gammaproteobacteria bacterium]|nr:hypothetical protein [Gammaproteobacteria bacterium]
MIKNVKTTTLGLALILIGLSQSAFASGYGKYCKTPMTALKKTLTCVTKGNEDAECATAGYNPEFVKLHNGVDTNTVIDGTNFWEGAFQILDLSLHINHAARIDRDTVSLRYVEYVEVGIPEFGIMFPTIVQHEHALITMDKDCKILKWDQYGDNKEQTDVDDAVAALLQIIGQAPAASTEVPVTNIESLEDK